MLSLWANWLQLNSQLNSPGVSFWLYRTYIQSLFQDLTAYKNFIQLLNAHIISLSSQHAVVIPDPHRVWEFHSAHQCPHYFLPICSHYSKVSSLPMRMAVRLSALRRPWATPRTRLRPYRDSRTAEITTRGWDSHELLLSKFAIHCVSQLSLVIW